MDGDGRLDFLIATSKGYVNQLLQNQGWGRFEVVEGAFDQAGDGKVDTDSIAVSDVNADGRVDEILANADVGTIEVVLNKVFFGACL